ncbi:protein TOPLESS-like [Solanum pennellii]|uniref:Protein TOPLESS-like n=1 Tax=Solanum pennellii TaxID=28526 RepID=A0ABM1V7K3_SOLPN|nr:protein TOPLESS-like [Solanum pennellii]XP_015069641.1 protein TOPLESS-like [Solanum pennellii]XP_027771721.1 protein TOPLESS-like [Solanum pennellii]
MASHNEDAGNVTPQFNEEPNDEPKMWRLTKIRDSLQCQSLKLPENLGVTKISSLIYTSSGNSILALASNAIHLLWKWQGNERNSRGKATASVSPQLCQPSSGILMTNDVHEPNHEEAVSCFALSKNDGYVISTSGGRMSLFNLIALKRLTTFMPPPPAATYIVFLPQDNNIIAIGMDDSTIQIYHVRLGEVKSKLKGHSKRITGLAFSHLLNVLVSSGADSQLCVWSTVGWEMQRAKSLQLRGQSISQSDTRVQFHQDQTHFLVVHEAQIAVYETAKLECLKQWVPRESDAPISHATYSCDSQLIYASFLDATVCIFTAGSLLMQCCIFPSAYLSPGISNSNIHPVVVAAHPEDPNQFALGMSDGGVHVFEPLESEGKWGVPPPLQNGFAKGGPASPAIGASGSD